jgi:RimJ/RimL family protein N-acetyltransferase
MKTMRLIEVNPEYVPQVEFLYDLLAERDPVANISHREMPTFQNHWDFVKSRPYKVWCMVYADDDPVGAVYLTQQNEIGVFISEAEQRNGYGKQAVELLMQMHPSKRFLANIAPGNARSLAMFEKLGFWLIQLTLAKETA